MEIENLKPTAVTSIAILEIASTVYGLKPRDLSGKRVLQTHTRARLLAVFLFREFRPGLHYSRIARTLRKDPTTIRHALERIDEVRLIDVEFSKRCDLALSLALAWRGRFTDDQKLEVASVIETRKRCVRVRRPDVKVGVHDSPWMEVAAVRANLKASERRFFAAVANAYPDSDFGAHR